MHPALKKHFQGKIELSDEHEQLIARCFVPLTAERNEILVEKGAVANHLYYVVKGCLRIYLSNEDLSESTRFLIFEDHFGTAFPSFILKQPSAATVQSVENSELLALSYENRELLHREIPGWESMNRKGLELDYIASIQRIESLITMNSADRYNLLLKKNPEMVLRLPSRIIADYLGINPETLSRLKSKK